MATANVSQASLVMIAGKQVLIGYMDGAIIIIFLQS